jgi:Fic family protein
MPTYTTTHPWITFGLDLGRFTPNLWMLLGEAKSKCLHIQGVPLQPEQAKALYLVFLSKGAHATTSIEGNTLSEEEVAKRIQNELPLPESREYQGKAVDNVVAAYNLIERQVLKGARLTLDRNRLCEFNKLVLRDLDLEGDAVPGELRRYSVGVANYKGAPHEDCEYLVDKLCEWLGGSDFLNESPAMAFTLALVKAVLAHLYIAWIHPFGDGNGRTARLVEFQLLVESGLVPLPAAHLLSNHFNMTRDRYYRELDRASKSGGNFIPFFTYAVQGFVDGLQEQLQYIRFRQKRDLWVNYVHERFHGQETPAASRRKHLILDMPMGIPVPDSKIREVSFRIAAAYVGKSERTIERDLKRLVAEGLLVRLYRSYVVNSDIIEAFLPRTIDPGQLKETADALL